MLDTSNIPNSIKLSTEDPASPSSIASKLWRVSPETSLSEEQELAHYNMSKWQEIEDCQQKIRYYQSKLDVLSKELQEMSSFTRLAYDPSTWRFLPKHQKGDKEVARALLSRPTDRLPHKFLDMLWGNPSCELRQDRDILLSSLEMRMATSVRVRLSEQMLSDKELLFKLTEKHPWYILQDTVPAHLFDDEALIRALLGGVALTTDKVAEFLSKLSPRLLNNADLMLESINSICRRCNCRIETPIVGEQLRDDKRFCLQVADVLLMLSEDHRCMCPLKYTDLSKRLRLDPDVINAFVKVDGANLIHAVNLLQATQQESTSTDIVCAPQSLFSKESVLQTFRDSSGRESENLIEFFNNLPLEIQQDRDVAVAASIKSMEIFGSALIQESWLHDRDYWFSLAEACPDFFEEYWESLPLDLQQDRELALFVARRACFTFDAASSFQGLFAQFPDLLMDPRVIINCVDNLVYELADLCRLIPREVWGKDFCLELLRCNGTFYEFVPAELRGDRDIVESALREDEAKYRHCVLPLLSKDVQLQYPDLIAEVIRNNPRSFDLDDIAQGLRSSNREVALALVSSGHHFEPHVLSRELCKDKEIFLALVEHQVEQFEFYCPSFLRHDKEFMLQVVKKNPACFQYLDGSLMDDFDVLLACFSQDHDHARHFVYTGKVEDRLVQGVAGFAREIRQRLQAYLSFMVFLGGISSEESRSSSCCALSLLDQGTDTALAYKKLIATYAGIPLGEQLCTLRQVSVGLTRWGF